MAGLRAKNFCMFEIEYSRRNITRFSKKRFQIASGETFPFNFYLNSDLEFLEGESCLPLAPQILQMMSSWFDSVYDCIIFELPKKSHFTIAWQCSGRAESLFPIATYRLDCHLLLLRLCFIKKVFPCYHGLTFFISHLFPQVSFLPNKKN